MSERRAAANSRIARPVVLPTADAWLWLNHQSPLSCCWLGVARSCRTWFVKRIPFPLRFQVEDYGAGEYRYLRATQQLICTHAVVLALALEMLSIFICGPRISVSIRKDRF